MRLRTYLATTRRILTQLRADRRTVGLIAIVPAALLTLLYFVYRDYPGADLLFNHIAVSMMAILRRRSCSWSPASPCCASA